MNKYRIGVVGTGGIAHAHLSGYRSVLGELGTVTAACDPRESVLADFAAKWSIPRTFATAGELIDSGEVDVLALLTPPAVRDEVIYPALERGVALLVEKPFGTSGRNAVRYVDAARHAAVPLAVGQNFRWFPEHVRLREEVHSGAIGEVEYIDARCFQDREQKPGVWRAEERKLEMAIFSVHIIDRIQALTSAEPEIVTAVTRRGTDTEIAGEQFTTLIVQFDDGSVGQMTSSWKSRGLPGNVLRVDGKLGSASAERVGPMSGPAGLSVQRRGEQVHQEAFPDDPQDPVAPKTYGYGMKELLMAMAEGREPVHSGRDNLRTMGIMEAAYLSAERAGAPVTTAEALDR